MKTSPHPTPTAADPAREAALVADRIAHMELQLNDWQRFRELIAEEISATHAKIEHMESVEIRARA